VSGRRNGVSNIVKIYNGVAKDVEAIIRLRPWITDEITEELKKTGVEVIECKFEWSYDPSTTHFDYIVNAIA
jgi:phosphoribosylaminoimidazole-succinocarboxamide synthase